MRKFGSRGTENVCVLHNMLEVHRYLNEYNKVKSSTIKTGYDVGVTDI